MNKFLSIILASLLILSGCSQKRGKYLKIQGYTQGTTYNITYCDRDTLGRKIYFTVDDIKTFIEQTLADVDKTISGYNKGSLLTKVNSGEDCELNPLFVEIFEISALMYQETDGYVDVSGGPLYDLWGFGFKKGIEPSEDEVAKAQAIVGMDKVRIVDNRIVKDSPAVQLNFNALAPGYTCDLIGRLFENKGITDYLIEIGGEVLCKGKNPSGNSWSIGIDTPKDSNNESGASLQAIISVQDAAIVTSGNYRKFYIKDGQKYSHTINPKTGRPVTHNLLSATVMSSDAVTADAYATYCMVLGLEGSMRFLESRPDLEGYLIYGEQEDMKVYYTPKMKEIIKSL